MWLIYAAQNLDEKNIRRFVEALPSHSKIALSTKIIISIANIFSKDLSEILTFDVRHSARKGPDEASRFSRTYQNIMDSTLEHYCDITFDV